ncbi:hypothetical protein VNO80_33822 [Phaseolus coccineus]|uniref:Uncharacterized protein n=1 Tax=Phaseolus coccineus TaxID=3886 RepID=A0AAN9KZC6_PHACN
MHSSRVDGTRHQAYRPRLRVHQRMELGPFPSLVLSSAAPERVKVIHSEWSNPVPLRSGKESNQYDRGRSRSVESVRSAAGLVPHSDCRGRGIAHLV